MTPRLGHGEERDQLRIRQQFDELFLQTDRKRLSRNQNPAQAAAAARVNGDFRQHHAADRGHHAHHRDAMALDQINRHGRIETFHHDDGRTQGQGIGETAHARAVGQGRNHQKAILS